MAFRDSLIFTSDDLVNAILKKDNKKLKTYFNDMKIKFDPVWKEVVKLSNKSENKWMTYSGSYQNLARFSSPNQDAYVRELEAQVIQLYNLVGNLTEVIQRMEIDIRQQADLLNLTTDKYKEALNFATENMTQEDIRKKFWKTFREEFEEYQKLGDHYDSDEVNDFFSEATAEDFFGDTKAYIEKALQKGKLSRAKDVLKGEF